MSAEIHIIRERNDVVGFLRGEADRLRERAELGDAIFASSIDLLADRIQRHEHEGAALHRGLTVKSPPKRSKE